MTDQQNVHGGNILATARKLGCAVDELIDMSSNLTPLGMAPGLVEDLAARLGEIRFLPESGSETLVALFAARHGLRPAQVLAGTGTTEFIHGLPAALGLRQGLIVTPTYADYQVACQLAGMAVESFPLRPEEGFRLDLAQLSAQLAGGELVFICNPNNPTGGMVSSAALHQLAKNHPDTVFLVDESYISFLREPSLVGFPRLDNLFVLGSFSKVYGIPGLRLGFLIASEGGMQRLVARSKPWGVNRLAQLAGEFLLQHGDAYVAEAVRFLEQHRPAFVRGLAALPGVEVMPGEAHFILCFLHGAMRAAELREKMLARRIMIRDCANFSGLDDRYFRVSMQSEANNQQCLAALADILKT
ncbi:MAG: histidinol phosphate aminotransferase [Deltaproteobacteria bacterium CG23_combo_of_CG06-09_8_20_14_all_60_8]|nr:MAG: histidinol phosphate aminotransferase [Deltaproteobacteria bacterium CG23_combo_of_CG06-09_8_20_14_all_60_8]